MAERPEDLNLPITVVQRIIKEAVMKFFIRLFSSLLSIIFFIQATRWCYSIKRVSSNNKQSFECICALPNSMVNIALIKILIFFKDPFF